MKKSAFFILAAVTLCCCEKRGKDCCMMFDNLVSKWELRKSVGGIAGEINYPPGLGFVVEFKSGNSYKYYYKDSVIQSGSYHLEHSGEKEQNTITFHTDAKEWSQDILLKGDTLVLLKLQPCCDYPDDTYVRVN